MTNISVEEACRVVREVREEHGLGDKYALDIEPVGRARWRIKDHEGGAAEIDAMDRREFRHWLEQFFVEAIAEHDDTMEG